MQRATCIIKTSDVHVIPVQFVTPPEAQVLMKIHAKGANGAQSVVQEAVLTGEVDGTHEFNRLTSKYNPAIIEEMWPGVNKRLPQTFEEIGVKTVAAPSVTAAPAPPDLPADDVTGDDTGELDATAEAPAPEPVVKPAPKVSRKKLP